MFDQKISYRKYNKLLQLGSK